MKTLKSFTSVFVVLLSVVLTAAAQTNLTALDGSRVNIEGQNGKIVILAVGASWLPLSGKQVDYTNALAKKYAGKNVAIYFVTTDSSNPKSKNYATVEAMQKWAFSNKISVPVLYDPDGLGTLKKFRIEQVPSFVVLDKYGALVGQPFGGLDPDPRHDITAPISRVVDKLL
ncbi:MAG: peroxiredoxin family protein [Pyrinomonadaceae bacterium]